MEVKFLSRAQTQVTFIALVENCDSMQWAVAWATENAVFEAAMKNSSKFEHFVVGTHMFQTQPEVLERAAALAAAAVVPPTGDLFHPKVYVFRNGHRIRCVVGSPNLTKAAMSRNVEASVLLDGSSDDAALAELSRFVADAWGGAEDISHEFLYRYRHQYAAKAAAREELTKFADIRPPSKPNTKRAPHDMSWADYLVQVRRSSHPSAHLFKERLGVLTKARALFATGIPYAKWSEDDRKLVAGTLGQEVPTARSGLRTLREHGREWHVCEPCHRRAQRPIRRPRFHPVVGQGHARRLRPLLQGVHSGLRPRRPSRRTADCD
jgi:HKD family nuclease